MGCHLSDTNVIQAVAYWKWSLVLRLKDRALSVSGRSTPLCDHRMCGPYSDLILVIPHGKN